MKLSILMPVYNERTTLESAVKRVLDVDYPVETELVIVDDGSTDGTRQLYGQWAGDPRVKAQIDGVTLATLAGVVTPQGYGRAEPVGHPVWTARAPELADWMRSQGYRGRICSVTDASSQITRLG